MRGMKASFGSAGRFLLRPGVWIPTFALVTVVCVSLAIAKLVVAPAILASDRYTSPALTKSVKIAEHRLAASGQSANALAFEPPVEIALVAEKRHRPKRKRARRHAPDVVYHAPAKASGLDVTVRTPPPPVYPEAGDTGDTHSIDPLEDDKS
jgi:hypothetical protein